MDLNSRVEAFVSLGQQLSQVTVETEEEVFAAVRSNNAWFNVESVMLALDGIVRILQEDELRKFTDKYVINNDSKKSVGIVMAGNLPAVGFHDLFMVLLSGNTALVKLSSEDKFLLPFIVQYLPEELKSKVSFIDKIELDTVDAIIATGSNNTSRYFETYFASKPNIIRKNRTSCAVLNGEETVDDFKNLGKDIFAFYGKGCRNVSKLFVPAGYSFQTMLDTFTEHYSEVIHSSKYSNNYDYYKSIFLVNREDHLDTGFLILKENKAFGAPLSVVYYEEYDNKGELNKLLDSNKDQIQCIVGSQFIDFGDAQCPAIDDFADSVDTMSFLLDL